MTDAMAMNLNSEHDSWKRSAPLSLGLTDEDIELNSRQVRAMFGEVSDMSIWRWMDGRGFPRPRKRSGRNFWVLSELRAWRREQDASVLE